MKRLLLCLAFLTSCTTVRVYADPEFPPVPESFPSPLGPVAVVWADSIPSEQPGFVVLGRFSPLSRTIYIWRGVKGRGEQWRVALHEVCHLRAWDRGIRQSDEMAEAMCDVMAYEVATLMRSPR
jgi:hypothetical protein